MLIFMIIAAVNCKKEDKTVPSPLGNDLLIWGENPSDIESLFLEKGWSRLPDSPHSIDYGLKMNEEDGKFDPVMDDVVYPYKVSLYFNENRLHMARLFRSGSSDTIADFQKKFLSMNSMNEPAWKNSENDNKEKSEYTYTSSEEIFSGKDIIAVIYKTSFISKENSVKDENIEIQIYSLKENEGISVKELAEGIKSI